MKKIEVTLISGRTARQGIGLEEGKPSDAYVGSVNHVLLSSKGAEKLGAAEGEPVKVTTEFGSVNVHWAVDKNLEDDLVFFPYGPWANRVFASETGSTGMPLMKGIGAVVESGAGDVPSLGELVELLKEDA